LPPGLELVDTAVQDAAFVTAAVLLAHVGGSAVRAWQFGLRRPSIGWRLVLLVAIPATYLTFFVFDLVWALLLHVTEKEKLLETLGANEGALLLVLSAALTCVIAPIAEEFLFRGFFFRALSNSMSWWIAALITGAVFGLVHTGSAPAEDLVPLAFLGFALCVLYRMTGSLYPCIAVHALNNCIAFGSLEGWIWWKVVLLIAASAAVFVALAVGLRRAGVIGDEPGASGAPAPVAA
jgi:membrane protease YdiL (CAAX protease family)